MTVWKHTGVDYRDRLNQEIWVESRQAQRELAAGGVSAHAVLQHDELGLPWMPDIVGRRWRRPGGAVVFGSAYAPFIDGHAVGRTGFSLDEFAADSAGAFLERFVGAVVQGDHRYYEPLGALLHQAFGDLQLCVLTDLVRGSVVKRGTTSGGDAAVRADPAWFMRAAALNLSWTAKRLAATRARSLVALGTLAESGLVRGLQSIGWRAWYGGGEVARLGMEVCEPLIGKPLYERLNDGDSWVLEAPNGHRWHLMTIYHPARQTQYDPDYAMSGAALKAHVSGGSPKDWAGKVRVRAPSRAREVRRSGRGAATSPAGGRVVGVHVVCRGETNVRHLGQEVFESGYWVVAEKHLEGIEYLALHESKRRRSYLQGEVIGWRHEEHQGRQRVVFTVRRSRSPFEWVGDGSGERGYKWR